MDSLQFERCSCQLVSKWGNDETRYHLLVYHLLDSAAVSLQMWDYSLSAAQQARVALWIGSPLETTRAALAYWCALHDLGKASPAFQLKNNTQSQKAAQFGFTFDRANPKDPHSLIGGQLIFEQKLAPRQVAIAISGHHGIWKPNFNCSSRTTGSGLWAEYRTALVEILRHLLCLNAPADLNKLPDPESNAFTVWLSGWLSVVDWVASNKENDEYKQDFEPLEQYLQSAMDYARTKLAHLGWIAWRASGQIASFSEMYPGFTPHNIQRRIFAEAQDWNPNKPFLLILEAPTGIGKTETALLLADEWLQRTGGSGLYVALPTTATSNQMYTRTTKIFQTRYPHDLLPFVLAHGQASWVAEINDFRVHEIDPGTQEKVIVADWFQNNRKRALLTPFGVGTVDQALLSVLKTKHFFVRLFGLSAKVVLFDEVHAYDSYMRELFAGLLGWLRHLGASVIILSATLPENFRQCLVKAYCGDCYPVKKDSSYPRITLAAPGRDEMIADLENEISEEQDREISLVWQNDADLIGELNRRLEGGGCAAVICNTVSRAQDLFIKLNQAQLAGEFLDTTLTLFHARFPLAWRNDIEKQVLLQYGKTQAGNVENPDRPFRAVVVATQVIEQSLDLDFDLIVSEFAPVDLLLQRAGRLHRHKRQRQPGLQNPTLVLLRPGENPGGQPYFGLSERIYPRSVLLPSYLALRERSKLKTVTETRRLIEQVYGDCPLPAGSELFHEEIAALRAKQESLVNEKQMKAQGGLIPGPAERNMLYAEYIQLNDEANPQLHRAYQAFTRDTDGLSLQIVCLHEKNGFFYLNPEHTGSPIVLETLHPGDSRLPEILGQNLTIQRRGVPEYLLGSGLLQKMDQIPALRHVYFMPFKNGVFPTPDYLFELDRILGLRIQKC